MLTNSRLTSFILAFYISAMCSLWSPVSGREYKIGLIANIKCCYDTLALETSASSINIAIDRLEEEGLIQNVTFSIIWRDARDEVHAIGAVVELVRDYNVDVIFGSPYSLNAIPIAYYTSFLNFPHISWIATSPKLTDKSFFKTIVRTLGPASQEGIAFHELFRKFGWKRVAIFYVKIGICLFSSEGVIEEFHRQNYTIVQSIEWESNTPLPLETIDHYLLMIKQTARIIVYCSVTNRRAVMIRACKLGMCNGEYMFVMPDLMIPDHLDDMQYWKSGDEDDEIAKEGYKYMLYVTVALWTNDKVKEQVDNFRREIPRRLLEPPWNMSYALDNGLIGNPYSMFMHDAMYLYGLWVNYTLTNNSFNHRDGRALFDFTSNLAFEGVDGPCYFDANADRIPFYWIWDFTEDGYPRIAALANTMKKSGEMIEEWKGFTWFTKDGLPPPDTPACGFYGEFCRQEETDYTFTIIGVCLAAVVIIISLMLLLFIIRKRQAEQEMMMNWKININDVDLHKGKLRHLGSKFGSRHFGSATAPSVASTISMKSHYMSNIGTYKGHTVVLREFANTHADLSRSDLLELKEMREMTHNNINAFIGANMESPSVWVIFLYCSKGSLQDILENDDIKLDIMFKNSLTCDLINGMCYLHSSKLKSHGRLKSTNCLVDNKWVLKISDYGLGLFTGNPDPDNVEEQQKIKSLLWTAPELLRMAKIPVNGTPVGDVYSFGIILHEIFYRMGTFAKSHMTTKAIFNKVKNCDDVPCRPEFFRDVTDAKPAVLKLMEMCWHENPADRRSFRSIKMYFKTNIMRGVDTNLMDVMLKRLEKYANNLEDIVDQRTGELLEEKRKTDQLLYRMLPLSVAEKLKSGETVHPEVFESVSIFFSDVVGFTSIASESSPMEVVDLLNDLYCLFDGIIENHDAYKVETIGDGYLVVSGLPKRNGIKHAGEIADLSLEILDALLNFRIRHKPDRRLMVRIGNHTGPCCAGVVGQSMPRYCLFGDTVNTASRMESSGEAQRIHISEASNIALRVIGGYVTTFRDTISIKGKGLMNTYWLESKEDVFTNPTSTYDPVAY